MALRRASAPAEAAEIVVAALQSRRRLDPLPALRGFPQLGQALPIYRLGSRSVAAANPLRRARRVGWLYPILGGDNPGLALLHESRAVRSFAGVSEGALPQALLEASILAERRLAQTRRRFEPRLLEIPVLHLNALWLYSRAKPRFFIPLDTWRADDPGSLRLTDDLQPRIDAVLAAHTVDTGFAP